MSFDLVKLILHYFTFLACGIGLLNLWMVRDRVSLKARLYLVSYPALFLIWGLLQMAGRYKTFFFVILPPSDNPLVAFFWIIYFAGLWVETVWIVWGEGAEELLKIGVVSGKKKLRTPQNIKLFYAIVSIVFPLLVLLGYLSGFFSSTVAELNNLFT